MPFITRKSLFTLVTLVVLALLLVSGFVWSGIYNIGADDTHTRPIYAVLQSLRERSIDARTGKLQVPSNLQDPARVRQGAGNYDAMCTGCHLAPGAAATELSKGLYPQPPNLSTHPVDAAHAFWVIKHGIKASGMPAWGKSMDDEYLWNMAAFLQELPKLDATQYQALVTSSGGHSHGGGETGGHSHAPGMEDHLHDEAGADHDAGEAAHDHAHSTTSAGVTHVHADGSRHVHAPAAAPAPIAPKTATATSPSGTTAADATAPATDEHAEHEHHH